MPEKLFFCKILHLSICSEYFTGLLPEMEAIHSWAHRTKIFCNSAVEHHLSYMSDDSGHSFMAEFFTSLVWDEANNLQMSCTLLFLDTSPFPIHPLFSPLQSPTFFSFCVHIKAILHSHTSKRTTELSYWGKRANRWAEGVWGCFRSLVSDNKAVKYSAGFPGGLYSLVCQGKTIS